jgi:hypothetical protein
MSFLSKIFLGFDLDEEQRRNDELDQQLAALNQAKRQDGSWTDEEFAQAEAHRIASNNKDIAGDVSEVFNKSIEDSVSSAASVTKGVLKTPFNFLFGAIPWQLWLVAAVALFIYAGGGVFLRGILARK